MIANADTTRPVPSVVDISGQFDLCDRLPEVDPDYDCRTPESPDWSTRPNERGMVTAEWAIGIIIAVSLAGLVLLFIVKGAGKNLLTGIILRIVNMVSGWGLKH